MKKALSQFQIGSLVLPNRLIKAPTFENMCVGERITEDYVDFHLDFIRNGIGMTTLGMVSVNSEGREFANHLYFHEGIETELTEISNRIHQEGGHCGSLCPKKVTKKRPKGASLHYVKSFNHLSTPMNHQEIESVVDDYASAARISFDCGVDCIELHCAHGYLLSEFISGFSNRRKDEYGGSIENRMRLPLKIVKRIREATDPDYPLVVKFNLVEFTKNGIDFSEAVEIAKMFEDAGVSALIPSRGHQLEMNPFNVCPGDLPIPEIIDVQQSRFMRVMGRCLMGFLDKFGNQEEFSPLYALPIAQELQTHVDIPVIYVGGVTCAEDVDTVLDSGFEAVQIGRALLHDSEMMNPGKTKTKRGRGCCVHCNKCISPMFLESGRVRCIMNKKE